MPESESDLARCRFLIMPATSGFDHEIWARSTRVLEDWWTRCRRVLATFRWSWRVGPRSLAALDPGVVLARPGWPLELA